MNKEMKRKVAKASELENKMMALLRKYGNANHPEVVAVRSELFGIQQQINGDVDD